MDIENYWYIGLIIILVLLFIVSFVWFLSLQRKKRKLPSHVQLYFDDNFRKIMGEWDFVTRDRVKTFKKDIGTRLNKVGTEIDGLEKKKKGLDGRMSRIETRISKLEGF